LITATLLDVDEAYLWRKVVMDQRNRVPRVAAELVDIYPNRGSVPPDLWPGLAGPIEAVDLLAYSALFLSDSNQTPPMTSRTEQVTACGRASSLVPQPPLLSEGRSDNEEIEDMASPIEYVLIFAFSSR
jgi:hypothetical protein